MSNSFDDVMESKPQRSQDELRMSLEHVTRQIIELETAKKEYNKNTNERLKDLRYERDAIIEQLG